MKQGCSNKKAKKGATERTYIEQSMTLAGVDEVGRGCIAGPVVAGCVILNYSLLWKLPRSNLALIRDSKTLTRQQRVVAMSFIEHVAIAQSIGFASVAEIETVGIQQAIYLAMNRAIDQIPNQIDLLLVDGKLRIKDQTRPQLTVIGGDALCFSIAAASIIAKQFRDDLMGKLGSDYPHFGFEKHVGYGTAQHLTAIKSHGICDLHRRNFAPIRDFIT